MSKKILVIDDEPKIVEICKDYLVKVVIPTEGDVYGAAAVHPDAPLYKVTKEEDINIANGDSFVPQAPPPACAGPLHIVDVAGFGADNYAQIDGNGTNGAPADNFMEFEVARVAVSSTATFVAAWRHVVRVFRAAGAANVTWLWTVNTIQGASSSLSQWWPR